VIRRFVLAAVVASVVTACAWFKANGPAIAKDVSTACTIADGLDPSLMTVVCGVIDLAENVYATTTIVCPTPQAAQVMVKALPASVTVAPKLKTLASLGDAGTYGAHRWMPR
jgi:hypothetical protein